MYTCMSWETGSYHVLRCCLTLPVIRMPRLGVETPSHGAAVKRSAANPPCAEGHQTWHFRKRATSVPHGLDFARLLDYPLRALQVQKWHFHGCSTSGAAWHATRFMVSGWILRETSCVHTLCGDYSSRHAPSVVHPGFLCLNVFLRSLKPLPYPILRTQLIPILVCVASARDEKRTETIGSDQKPRNSEAYRPTKPSSSGLETGKRKRVARKADGKLTLLVNLGGPGTKSWRFWLPISACPF